MDDFLRYGVLPRRLPAGCYHFEEQDFNDKEQLQRAILAWGLGSYQFSAYRHHTPISAKLFIPKRLNMTFSKIGSPAFI